MMKKKSIYETFFKKKYSTFHNIAYNSSISIGSFTLHSADVLLKLYQKHMLLSSLFPAPRLHVFHPDKIETRHRRLQTAINYHPFLSDQEKIRIYQSLKNKLFHQMKLDQSVKFSTDTRWEFNHLIKRYDQLITRLQHQMIP